MKSFYKKPELEITLFETEKILLTSGTGNFDLDSETGLSAEEVFGS